MRILSSMTIAGQPALLVRKLMKRGSIRLFEEDVSKVFGGSSYEIGEILQMLEQEGYIVFDADYFESFSQKSWRLTTQGNALVNASAAKPIKRLTAERLLAQLLARVQIVNQSSHYAFIIKKVVVFGSYLSDSSELGDLDIAIELAPRGKTNKERDRLTEESIKRAVDEGRHFNNPFERMVWPNEEIYRFLKAGSRAISLHSTDDAVLQIQGTLKKTVFQQ